MSWMPDSPDTPERSERSGSPGGPSPRKPRKPRLLPAGALLAAAAVALVIGLTRGGSEAGNPGADTGTAASAPAAASPSGPAAASPRPPGTASAGPFGPTTARSPSVPPGMGAVRIAQLPAEAQETLRRIDTGGPFPYAKDGSVFGNREGRLPKQKNGYYREYTVETPGSDDRGARRVITGNAGEQYYTADHYTTFRVIVP